MPPVRFNLATYRRTPAVRRSRLITMAIAKLSSLSSPPSSRGDDDVDGECGDAGGGTRGRRHLQNDGDRRGRDPSGSNMSLEEEDDDDSYSTPAGAPDSTATVRRRRSSHIKQRQRWGCEDIPRWIPLCCD